MYMLTHTRCWFMLHVSSKENTAQHASMEPTNITGNTTILDHNSRVELVATKRPGLLFAAWNRPSVWCLRANKQGHTRKQDKCRVHSNTMLTRTSMCMDEPPIISTELDSKGQHSLSNHCYINCDTWVYTRMFSLQILLVEGGKPSTSHRL